MKLKRVMFFLILYVFIIYILIAGIPGIIAKIQLSKYHNIISGTMVDVYFEDQDTTKRMDIEQYIIGVLTAEMPASFKMETLKAQAVAARTYTYSRMIGLFTNSSNHEAPVCTNASCCQGYIQMSDTNELWNSIRRAIYEYKIRAAVYETIGTIITYESESINPLYHSNSGGQTENNEDVWEGAPLPYLRSKISQGDESSPYFTELVEITRNDFIDAVTNEYAKVFLDNNKSLEEQIDIISYTEGGSVDVIKIGTLEIKGIDFRKLFNLNSCKISLEYLEDNIILTVRGNGHGVGMSQWGANYLASQGYTYQKILKYYYSGIEIEKMW